MNKSAKRSAIFNEFTPEEQEFYFSIKEKAVSHHIDTLYYFVKLSGDMVNVQDGRFLTMLDELS